MPSACPSALQVPNLQLVSTAVDSHLHWNDLPLDLKFSLLVDDVTAKGPFVIVESFG